MSNPETIGSWSVHRLNEGRKVSIFWGMQIKNHYDGAFSHLSLYLEKDVE